MKLLSVLIASLFAITLVGPAANAAGPAPAMAASAPAPAMAAVTPATAIGFGPIMPMPMVTRDCGWTGCTFYFNKSETRKIAWGVGSCASLAPHPAVKLACAVLTVWAGYAVAANKCVAYKVGIGAGPRYHSGKHCR